MLRSEFATEGSGDGERLAARILTQFLLRHCLVLAKLADGDLTRGLVLAAMLDANLRHLRHYTTQSRRFGGLHAVPPDEERKPISVSALARSLNMPYETVRRQVGKLIDTGVCERVGDEGVIVRTAWIAAQQDVTSNVYASLKSMLAVLHSAGFDLDAMATDQTPQPVRERRRRSNGAVSPSIARGQRRRSEAVPERRE